MNESPDSLSLSLSWPPIPQTFLLYWPLVSSSQDLHKEENNKKKLLITLAIQPCHLEFFFLLLFLFLERNYPGDEFFYYCPLPSKKTGETGSLSGWLRFFCVCDYKWMDGWRDHWKKLPCFFCSPWNRMGIRGIVERERWTKGKP